ncbi:hypothetical protein PIB30_076588 [Stylosanthes scabra]|uniref:Uncharacterized protein n=1 Tax=Stylosanthes scabra TaxID=79078 RepID=A0ABU6YPB0_9FABA|nr:hypothetical protein [Stylosanthes scabra]
MAAGLIKTAKMHVEKEGKSKKKAKKRSSSSSESEYVDSSYESESGSDESDSEQTMFDSLDGHTLDQAVSSIRKKSANLFVEVYEQHHQQPHQQPPEEEELPHEQPPSQQPHQPCQQQQPQQEFIDISSCSEGEPGPTLIRVLIPKAELDIVSTTKDRLEEEAPSQSVIEVVSEDEHEPQPHSIKVIVPKVEEGLVTSPSSKLITEVLMSMGQNKGQEPTPDSPHDPFIPSFSLNIDLVKTSFNHCFKTHSNLGFILLVNITRVLQKTFD